jgi:hypothetical protein
MEYEGFVSANKFAALKVALAPAQMVVKIPDEHMNEAASLLPAVTPGLTLATLKLVFETTLIAESWPGLLEFKP